MDNLYIFLYTLFNPSETNMRNQTGLSIKWRKMEVSASGVPALLTVVIISLCIVAGLAITHVFGCVFI